MAQIQFKGKSFVQNHHLLVKYHELIPKDKDMALVSSGKVRGKRQCPILFSFCTNVPKTHPNEFQHIYLTG